MKKLTDTQIFYLITFAMIASMLTFCLWLIKHAPIT